MKQRGCLKSKFYLTAKNTKLFRKDRKDLFYNILTLCPLRLLSVLCG